jgi:hypothetical protein
MGDQDPARILHCSMPFGGSLKPSRMTQLVLNIQVLSDTAEGPTQHGALAVSKPAAQQPRGNQVW